MTTLPTPEIVNGRERSIRASFLVRTDATSTEVAEVTVSHWGAPQKCYVANLHRVTVTPPRPDSIFESRLYKNVMTGGVKLGRESAPRYNASDLRSFLNATLARMDEFMVDPKTAEIFNPAWDATT